MKNYQKKYEIHHLKKIIEQSNLILFIQYHSPSFEEWNELKELVSLQNYSIRFFSNRLLGKSVENTKYAYLKHMISGSNFLIWENVNNYYLNQKGLNFFLIRSKAYQVWALKKDEFLYDYPKINRILHENVLRPEIHNHQNLMNSLEILPKTMLVAINNPLTRVIQYLDSKSNEKD